MSPHADHIRGLTVFLDARVPDANGNYPPAKHVSLCPGARVYAYTLSARSVADPVPDTLAILRLQDSQIELPSYGCGIAEITHALGPGLAWPASAEIEAAPGSFVTLHVTYGHCA